jgi:hypothetical protein
MKTERKVKVKKKSERDAIDCSSEDRKRPKR